MTEYRVVFMTTAENHLDDLYTYIAEHSGQARAEDFVGAIVGECLSLKAFPERGTKRDDIRPNLHTMGYTKRVTIAFAVDAETATVAILGVYYGGRDFERQQEDDK